MKLALRFLVFVVAGIFFALAVFASVNFVRQVAAFDVDLRTDHRVLARLLGPAFSLAWNADGRAGALGVLELLNAPGSSVRARFLEGRDAHQLLDEHEVNPDGLMHSEFVDAAGDHHLTTYVPLPMPAGSLVELRESTRPRRDFVHASLVRTALTALGIFGWCSAVTVILGVVVIGRPIRSLVVQARRVGAGELGARVSLDRRDELGELAEEMNRMADRLESEEQRRAEETDSRLRALAQLRHADRLATVGQLASGIAHELGTPLNVVTGRAQLMLDSADRSKTIERNATVIKHEAERMVRLIRQLLDFARAGETVKSKTQIGPLLEQVVGILRPTASEAGVQLRLALRAPDTTLEADGGQLEQVFMNLVMNAIQAMPRAGTVEVTLDREEGVHDESSVKREWLVVRVTDEGIGMPPQMQSRIFEPFFTTKEVGSGTGLGLSVAHGIIQEHGGSMVVESTVGKGSRFSVYLPA